MTDIEAPGAACAHRCALKAGRRTAGRRQRLVRRARCAMVSLFLTLAQMTLPVRVEPGRAPAPPADRLVLAQAITVALNLRGATPVL